jgi:hypothetical protein
MEPTQSIAVPEPTTSQSNRSDGFSFSTYLLSFAIAIILYALSPGPIDKCVQWYAGGRNPSYERAAQTVYAPINFCSRRLPALMRFYKWYMKDFWHLR